MKGNVRTVRDCPVCSEPGRILKQHRRLLACKCPKCGYEWNTLKVGGKEGVS